MTTLTAFIIQQVIHSLTGNLDDVVNLSLVNKMCYDVCYSTFLKYQSQCFIIYYPVSQVFAKRYSTNITNGVRSVTKMRLPRRCVPFEYGEYNSEEKMNSHVINPKQRVKFGRRILFGSQFIKFFVRVGNKIISVNNIDPGVDNLDQRSLAMVTLFISKKVFVCDNGYFTISVFYGSCYETSPDELKSISKMHSDQEATKKLLQIYPISMTLYN